MHPIHQWREVQEWLRLNKIYQGLRVSDDRPRYVFQGKSREYYDKFHPDKKTKAVYIPGLKQIYRPIYGAAPGTYYMREDGTAANLGAATGPGSSQGDCMNRTVHDAASITAADVIKVCDDGGIFRGGITPQWGNEGTAENPIIYEPESGDTPQFWGSTNAATWADQGSNKWRCDFGATAPESVWFSKSSVIHWGVEVADTDSLAAEYDWYYDGSQYLWCYSANDPDSAYDWVEGATVQYGMRCDDSRDYYTIDGLEFRFFKDAGIIAHGGGDGYTIQNCDIAYIGKIDGGADDGIVINKSNSIVQDNVIHDCGTHGIYVFNGGLANLHDIIVQSNDVYDCFHTLIDVMHVTGTLHQDHIIRYNKCHFTDAWSGAFGCNGIYIEGESGSLVDDVDIYYNLVYQLGAIGIHVDSYASNIRIYNNTISKTHPDNPEANDFGISIGGGPGLSNITLKNNIVSETEDECLIVVDSSWIASCDNNLWYKSSGDYITVDSTGYDSTEFSAYKAATGWDTNGKWQDPLFLDADNDDFHLQSGSPCIEAGTPIAGLTRDKDGRPLGRGTNPDIGCFETLKGGPRRL